MSAWAEHVDPNGIAIQAAFKENQEMYANRQGIRIFVVQTWADREPPERPWFPDIDVDLKVFGSLTHPVGEPMVTECIETAIREILEKTTPNDIIALGGKGKNADVISSRLPDRKVMYWGWDVSTPGRKLMLSLDVPGFFEDDEFGKLNDYCYRGGPEHRYRIVDSRYHEQSGETLHYLECELCGYGRSLWSDDWLHRGTIVG